MNTSYDVEKWAAETVRGKRIFNYHYRLDGRELPGWKLIKTVALTQVKGIDEKAYLWQSQAETLETVVRVDVAELKDWRAAQQRLAGNLLHCMRPEIPRGTGKLNSIGDIIFIARQPLSDVPASISFTMGNVCIAVRCVEGRTVDVSEIASRVERSLSEPPAKKELAKEFVLKKNFKATVRAGKKHKLFENLADEISADTWMKIIVPSGELLHSRFGLVFVAEESGDVKLPYYLLKKK